ncbi:hypothetical protein B0H11DRAFT_1164024 [Mycena galericulata]|nr:hypothetical protein B0H11DRAFT_1164024 [Mycena galericulata]
MEVMCRMSSVVCRRVHSGDRAHDSSSRSYPAVCAGTRASPSRVGSRSSSRVPRASAVESEHRSSRASVQSSRIAKRGARSRPRALSRRSANKACAYARRRAITPHDVACASSRRHPLSLFRHPAHPPELNSISTSSASSTPHLPLRVRSLSSLSLSFPLPTNAVIRGRGSWRISELGGCSAAGCSASRVGCRVRRTLESTRVLSYSPFLLAFRRLRRG